MRAPSHFLVACEVVVLPKAPKPRPASRMKRGEHEKSMCAQASVLKFRSMEAVSTIPCRPSRTLHTHAGLSAANSRARSHFPPRHDIVVSSVPPSHVLAWGIRPSTNGWPRASVRRGTSCQCRGGSGVSIQIPWHLPHPCHVSAQARIRARCYRNAGDHGHPEGRETRNDASADSTSARGLRGSGASSESPCSWLVARV